MSLLVIAFMTGGSLWADGLTDAKQDTWICLILAFLLGIPLVWFNSRIIEAYPGRNYFENIIRATGRPVGKALCAIFLFYCLHWVSVALRSFSEFIHLENMTSTPLVAIAAPILGVSVYVLKRRVQVLAQLSYLVFFDLGFVLITVFAGLDGGGAAGSMHFDNIEPILGSSWQQILSGAMLVFPVPIAEVIFCSPLFVALDPKEKVFPVFFRGYLVGFLALLIIFFRNLLILGDSAGRLLFPSYEAVSVVSIGSFFNRVEVLIGVGILIMGFLKISVFLSDASEVTCTIFNLDNPLALLSTFALIILTASMVVFSSTEEMFDWIKHAFWFAIPIEIVLPAAVLIIDAVRKKMHPKGGPKQKTKKSSQKATQPEKIPER